MKVYIESGSRKVFAGAVDWPGWSRSAKTEELAVEALAAYRERYLPVAGRAGLSLPGRTTFEVHERVAGNATTDFGAPGVVPDCDRRRLTAPQAEKVASLVEAAWATLDAIAATAPAELRKGPRGGGRDRDRMVDHVLGAEAGYFRQVGLKFKPPGIDDAGAIAEMRDAFLDLVRARPSGTTWPLRYAARRVAWHALDHAWEMEDRST